MPVSAPGSRRRRRFFRRHPMGLPTVFLVALTAAGGFWWTLKAPDHTGNLATSSDELSIPRGCHLESADLCHASTTALELVSAPAVAPTTLCRNALNEGFTEVWRDDLGNVGLHWSLPATSNAVYPLSSAWVATWAGSGASGGIHVSNQRSGWAVLPDTFAGAEVTVWAGSTAMGGDLEEGLASLHAEPFAARPDGTVRLAAHVNGDAIVLEVPTSGPYDVVRVREQLRFSEWTTGPLPCVPA